MEEISSETHKGNHRPARGPDGWHAVIVEGELFGVLPSQADANLLARRLAESGASVTVAPVVGDASAPLDGESPSTARPPTTSE